MTGIGIDSYLLAPGDRLVRLEAGRVYRFGRHEGSDFRVDDHICSREHCRLEWDPAKLWVVEDLGSRNGTYVNGVRLEAQRPTPLDDHDVLQVGGQRFTLYLLPPGSDTSQLAASAQTALSAQNTFEFALAGGAPPAMASFKGELKDRGLKEMLRFFALTNKSGRLMLDGLAERQIWFLQGVPRAAVCGGQSGLPALSAIAEDPGTTFAFHEGEAPERADITGTVEELLRGLYGDAELSALGIDANDLKKAERLQQHLLANLPKLDGYDLAVYYKGLSGVSGDFYDVGRMADGSVLVTLGDVSGHGIQAAMVVAGMMKTLRHLRQECRDLGELLTRLNEEVRGDLIEGQFMTMFAGKLTPATGELTVVLAGHHPAYLLDRARPGWMEPVGKTGMALGLAPSATFRSLMQPSTIRLAAGAVLVQYTDGLLEAMAANQEEYGNQRLQASVHRHLGGPTLQHLVDHLAEDVQAFARIIDDDLTVLALGRIPDAPVGGQPTTANIEAGRVPSPGRRQGDATEAWDATASAAIHVPTPAAGTPSPRSQRQTTEIYPAGDLPPRQQAPQRIATDADTLPMGDRGEALTAAVAAPPAPHGPDAVRTEDRGGSPAPPPPTADPGESTPAAPHAPVDPQIGRLLGQVKLICAIGAGSMAKVYRGHHQVMDHDVAVKIMTDQGSVGDDHRRKRFLREARVSGRIMHQNVVQVLDAGIAEDGTTYLVMPLMEGGNLGQRLAQGGRLGVAELLQLAGPIAQGLAAIHRFGAVHRDLKPDNILLDLHGVPKIADLGMIRSDGEDLVTKITKTGVAMGTPYYLAPETIRGTHAISPKVDIYSLGVSFYHLLAGRPPFDGATVTAVMAAHLTGAYVPLSQLVPQASPALVELIHSCMSLDPDRRPDAEQLAQAFAAIVQAEPAPAASAPHQVQVADWARRVQQGKPAFGLGRKQMIAAIIAALAVGVGLVWLIFHLLLSA